MLEGEVDCSVCAKTSNGGCFLMLTAQTARLQRPPTTNLYPNAASHKYTEDPGCWGSGCPSLEVAYPTWTQLSISCVCESSCQSSRTQDVMICTLGWRQSSHWWCGTLNACLSCLACLWTLRSLHQFSPVDPFSSALSSLYVPFIHCHPDIQLYLFLSRYTPYLSLRCLDILFPFDICEWFIYYRYRFKDFLFSTPIQTYYTEKVFKKLFLKTFTYVYNVFWSNPPLTSHLYSSWNTSFHPLPNLMPSSFSSSPLLEDIRSN